MLVFAAFALAFVGVVASATEIPLGNAPEQASPQDWISESQIKVFDSGVFISIPHARWAQLADTNSMDPVFDEGAHVIEVVPKLPTDVAVGDVVSYETDFGVVVHRVVGVGEDGGGIYYTVKGDNNTLPDAKKVRFDDVRGVLVAVVY